MSRPDIPEIIYGKDRPRSRQIELPGGYVFCAAGYTMGHGADHTEAVFLPGSNCEHVVIYPKNYECENVAELLEFLNKKIAQSEQHLAELHKMFDAVSDADPSMSLR